MTTINALDFIVKVDQLQESQFVPKSYSDELSPNQVLLEIDQFSLTSNNITYGVVGERLNYWKFFPTRSGFGIIPAWGFANVIVSNHPEVQVGQRFFGYYPMSSHLLVTAGKVSSAGFVDRTAHRQVLPSIYNFYTNTAQDPSFTPETEYLVSIFRPLFTTSFLIDDYLAEQNFFEATQIILTSASSKTAQALAALLADRKKKDQLPITVLGLTSDKNLEFVKELGTYDLPMAYNEIVKFNLTQKSVVVDFTGNHSLQFQLQTLLGKQLVYNCLVGLADWKNLRGEKPLPKKGEFFFAPTHAEKRQKDWGLAGFQQGVGIAWEAFIATVQPQISIKEYSGPSALKQVYNEMLTGEIDPKHGNIMSLKTP